MTKRHALQRIAVIIGAFAVFIAAIMVAGKHFVQWRSEVNFRMCVEHLRKLQAGEDQEQQDEAIQLWRAPDSTVSQRCAAATLLLKPGMTHAKVKEVLEYQWAATCMWVAERNSEIDCLRRRIERRESNLRDLRAQAVTNDALDFQRRLREPEITEMVAAIAREKEELGRLTASTNLIAAKRQILILDSEMKMENQVHPSQ